MFDPRILKLADVLVGFSCNVQKGENVLIENIGGCDDLARALVKRVYAAGANPFLWLGDKALNHYPESFAWFGQGYVWGALSFEFALFILLAAAFTFLLHKTNFGRRTYAIGNNPTGAWFSGINVKRHNLVLFALVGLMAGLAAVLLTSRLGSTRPTLAMGWELAVVTMAVLGGVNILGGSGSMVGVIIAAFLMGLVTFGLSLLNVPGIVMSMASDSSFASSARALSSSFASSSFSSIAARTLLAAWPKTGRSSADRLPIVLSTAVSSPFLPRNRTRSASSSAESLTPSSASIASRRIFSSCSFINHKSPLRILQ